MLAFLISGHRVACFAEGLHHLIHRRLFVIELNRERVLVHIGLNRVYVGNCLDGRTGLRGGAASDNPRRLKHIGHLFGG